MKKMLMMLSLVTLLVPAAAWAGNETALTGLPGWYSRVPTGALNTHMYFAVDALDSNNLYIGGMNIASGSMQDIFLKTKGLAFISYDAGEVIRDIANVIGAGMAGSVLNPDESSMCTMSDLESWQTEDDTGHKTRYTWAACGNYIGLARQTGKFDVKFDAPTIGDKKETFTVMHSFDGKSGVIGTASGSIYRFELSDDEKDVTFTEASVPYMGNPEHPDSSPSIVAMHFIDGRNGWVAATEAEVIEVEEYDRPPVEEQYYYRTHILVTSDGGGSWTEASTIDMPNEDPVHTVSMLSYTGPLTFEGGWIAQEIEMIDRDEGFLALSAYDNTEQQGKVAKLLRTIDGGKNWSDCMINMQVGTISSMFGDTQIFISEVAAMHFWRGQDDVIRGRVAASAFVTKGGSGSGGNPPKYFAVAMFGTEDGGATWNKAPELGKVEYDMMSQSAPACATGRLFDADFIDRYTGFGVGEKGTVFRFQHKCTKQSDCEFGYFCSVEEATKLQCVPCSDIGLTTHPGSIDKCGGWEPPPEPDPDLGGRDAIEGTDSGSDSQGFSDVISGNDLRDETETSGSGCSGSAGKSGTTGATLLLMLALIGIIQLRRRTT